MSAVVNVPNDLNKPTPARILLDTCATANFVTDDFVRKLNLKFQKYNVHVGAVNNLNTVTSGIINLNIHSTVNDFTKTIECLIISNISKLEPNKIFPYQNLNLPLHLNLADPKFYIPRPVDILLGSGPTASLLQSGQIKLTSDNSDIYLQKTKLGWVVVGGYNSKSKSRLSSCHFISLRDQIERFWKIEETFTDINETKDEFRCEKHFLDTTSRESNGRYVVYLPFRYENVELGDSRTQALRRFYSLQAKLNKQSHLKTEYHKIMQSYTDLGHMSLIDNEDPNGYFIPHHAVTKSTSATTKVRVVFDASAKTSNGLSLNDVLMVGPTIQDKLFTHLTRFRTHAFVLTADIEQMYRQILLHPDHRKYQQIFWYHNGGIRVYQLNTVTFGISASPFLAIRTINKLADDEVNNFPRASKILKRDLYVDNLLTGANSLQEILEIRNEIIDLCKKGLLNIRQWGSNHRHALDNVHEKIFNTDNIIDESPLINTLGLSWDARTDSFIYKSQKIDCNIKFTKRNILSQIARIFDPLGLLGPIIFSAKLIMQDCWRLKDDDNKNFDWDSSVPKELSAKWSAFLHQLNDMSDVVIPRYCLVKNPKAIQIHGFCDASKRGYGANIYLKSVNESNKISINLVCSKSRIAPIKEVTIPRLELCAALLLARLYKETITALELKFDRKVFWTDSAIVLQWLKKSPQILQPFESRRIKEIQALGTDIEWRHVRTRDNPADSLSRGQYPTEFMQNNTWFSGPLWLRKPENFWPINHYSVITKEFSDKGCLITSKSETLDNEIFKRFSSFSKLIRVLAYCYRTCLSNNYKGNVIELKEKIQTEIRILQLIQQEQFGESIKAILHSKSIKNSKLSSLAPFVDKDGLLRVGGRLSNSQLTNEQRHPILLPSHHYITDLIIRETHLNTHHSGIQSTLFNIRQKFWLLDGKNQVRQIVRKCVICIRHRPTPIQYQMADLPECRVRASSAFDHTGIDFFGPLYIKEKKFRNRIKIKAYGCVFICMATKAVHIEVTSDLTTEGFLAALHRFVSRRAIPSKIHSDNGTNFLGAKNELRELYALFNSKPFQERVNTFAIEKQIEWHFNPPASPHFGGIWEAAVKSFKHHLKRVIGAKLLTFEELNTLLIEIEAILNSRPLWNISTDPNDPIALTPAHILVGKPLTSLPEKNLLNVSENRLNTWAFITKARQDFWRRWHIEYLHELQRRVKWHTSKSNISEGSVVILIDKDHPCIYWELGIVCKTYPGSDEIIRVVDIRTKRGVFRRNTTTLCPLPTKE